MNAFKQWYSISSCITCRWSQVKEEEEEWEPWPRHGNPTGPYLTHRLPAADGAEVHAKPCSPWGGCGGHCCSKCWRALHTDDAQHLSHGRYGLARVLLGHGAELCRLVMGSSVFLHGHYTSLCIERSCFIKLSSELSAELRVISVLSVEVIIKSGLFSRCKAAFAHLLSARFIAGRSEANVTVGVPWLCVPVMTAARCIKIPFMFSPWSSERGVQPQIQIGCVAAQVEARQMWLLVSLACVSCSWRLLRASRPRSWPYPCDPGWVPLKLLSWPTDCAESAWQRWVDVVVLSDFPNLNTAPFCRYAMNNTSLQAGHI